MDDPDNRQPAFTLIELLVSIAVAAVLIAIALPTIAGARATAKRARCMANLRSMGTGISVYQNDNDGLLPWAVFPIDVRLQWTDPLPAIAANLHAEAPTLDMNGDVHTGEPWTCPADDAEGLANGVSYIYAPYDLMAIDTSANPGRTVTTIYEIQHWFPLMMDEGSLHRTRRDARGRAGDINVLLIDGSVKVADH